jgi:hypothetical protein
VENLVVITTSVLATGIFLVAIAIYTNCLRCQKPNEDSTGSVEQSKSGTGDGVGKL